MSGVRKPSLTRLLSSKNAADLNVLLSNEVQISDNVLQKCTAAVESFIEHLNSRLQTRKEFQEILIGGSLGTKTEINSEEDVEATLHVIYAHGSDDVTKCMTSFKDNLSSITASMQAHIRDYESNIEIVDRDDGSMCCTLIILDCPIDVELEIIPSFGWDVHDDEKREELYNAMVANAKDRRVYATSLCRLQLDYITQNLKNTRVRNLIRLVLLWLQRAFTVDEKYQLPSAYSIQYLVISLWERAGRPETFKPSAGFRAVMEALQNYSDLYITWNVYYDKKMIKEALVNQRKPILMDPCDPTKNYASECNCWNDVGMVATATLGKPIIKDVSHNPRWQ